jgi:NADH-quinone oxidoreductase subunit F
MPELALVLAGADERDLTRLSEYRAIGGYRALEKARGMDPEAVIEELLTSNLRGRGGAFFPMGRKASFIPKADDVPKPRYVVVNADESEPGTFKDRELMFRVPHRLIEGCLITAHAIRSQNVFIYIRGEYLAEFEVVRAALDEAREEGLFAGVTVVLHRGAGAYICGEESALLESLEGNVVRGGNYELELGTSLNDLIFEIGGGIPNGRKLKAVIPGGSSVPVLTAGEVDTRLEHDAMTERGSMLGSGAVIVIDDRCCMVQLGLRVAQFYMHESCGKCTPCREGTRWMVQLLHKIEDGRAEHEELDLLLSVCDRILGKCLCPLGDAAAMPIASYVSKFRDEFRAHIDEGGCPFGGESSLEGVLAPVDQHTHHPVAEVPA